MRLDPARIRHAHTVIDDAFRNTPQFAPESLGRKLGAELVVKVETLNPIRSFKARGALFLASTLTATDHLVCTTTGNFGQGLAYAARARGLRASIFTPADANPAKIAKMRSFGGDVHPTPGTFGDVRRAAEAFAAEHGAKVVIDGREPAIAEGAGTIGLELLAYPKPFATLLVPLGDGALINGIATIVKAESPATRIVGVCAKGAPAFEASWRSGEIATALADTIADGLAIETPERVAIDDAKRLVDDIVAVDDAALREAMKLIHAELGVVVEPSGAAGIAALMVYPGRFTGGLVGTVLTGGNVREDQSGLAS